MPNINIDTRNPQYVSLLDGLATLRDVLAPQIKLLRQLPRDKQRAWLQRDPLLRRAIRLALELRDLLDEEFAE